MARNGKFLGIPYDWRRPTKARFTDKLWNPAEARLNVPKAFGWGWTINFARLLGKRRPPR